MTGHEQQPIQSLARQAGLYFRNQKGWQRSLVVRLGDKMTDLPMHGGNKELKKGLIEGVKKRLGLK
jgi:mRNA interferase HicA